MEPASGQRLSFAVSGGPFRHGRDFRHDPFSAGPSGCFFHGVAQVCYFEPFLAMAGFGDFAYGDDLSFPAGPDADSMAVEEEEMAETAPPAVSDENPPPENTAKGNSGTSLEAQLGASEDRDLSANVYVLVLRNGTTHAVTDYWVRDGYLEYVSLDAVRSHIPLGAFDLQGTVDRNHSRGIPFVLRAAPGG
jgi:hypothetical protein